MASSEGVTGIFARKHISAATMNLFGAHVDGARETVVLPLLDVYGRELGAMYRTAYAKCLYDKANNVRPTELLYGLHVTYKYLMATDYAIVVEGPFDFLRVYDTGIKNVVSTLGAAMSWEQMCLLGRFCSSVFLCYDNDDAGREATDKAVRILKKGGLLPVPVVLDQDPDDYVNAYGAQKLEELCFQSLQSIDPSLSIKL